MKTSSFVLLLPVVCAALGVAATAATASSSSHRQLQFAPPGANSQIGLQGQFGAMPPQGNGFNQAFVPTNGQQQPGVPSFGVPNGPQNFGPGTPGAQNFGGRGTGTGEADVTTTAGTGAASGSAATPANPAAPTAPTNGALAPGQPTLMVILPDSIAAHSGWSSLSGDVGVTKAPAATKPKPKEQETPVPTSSAATNEAALVATLLVAAASVANALD